MLTSQQKTKLATQSYIFSRFFKRLQDLSHKYYLIMQLSKREKKEQKASPNSFYNKFSY